MSGIGFGNAPWGIGPWGGGPGNSILQIVTAQAVRENLIRIEFTESLYFSGLLDVDDAAQKSLYEVLNAEGVRGIDGELSRPVRIVAVSQPAAGEVDVPSKYIDLTLDRAMSPYPCVYQVRIVGTIYTASKLDSLGGVQYGIYGAYREIQKPTLEPQHGSRDLASVQSGKIEQGSPFNLGTYVVSDDGDIAFDEGIANLKKRVLRRLITVENGFAHLPGYGVGMASYGKKLAQNSVISGLVTKAETQLRSEPDVAVCRVVPDLTNISKGLLRLLVSVKMKDGRQVNWGFNIKIGG